MFVYSSPWGSFSFADAGARQALTAYCDEHEIDLVAANPTLGLGVAGSGRPDETQQFVDCLIQCGLYTTRAFWLLHHENKAGQISGDWGRHADTKMLLQQDGNRPRTKLTWEKTRWATLPAERHPKSLMLEWTVATKGYRVVEADTAGATDEELQARVNGYLSEHPWSSTTTVETNVKGTASRIRALLDAGPYDTAPGPRGATLWAVRADGVTDRANHPVETSPTGPRRSDGLAQQPASTNEMYTPSAPPTRSHHPPPKRERDPVDRRPP